MPRLKLWPRTPGDKPCARCVALAPQLYHISVGTARIKVGAALFKNFRQTSVHNSSVAYVSDGCPKSMVHLHVSPILRHRSSDAVNSRPQLARERCAADYSGLGSWHAWQHKVIDTRG